MYDYNSLGYLIAGMGVLFIFVLILALVMYIVCAIGIKKVLNYYGHENSWMAFIPIVSTIALVQCMKTDSDGNVQMFGKLIKRSYFMWFPVLQFVVTFIPGIGSLLSLAIGIIGLGTTYQDLLSRANTSGDTTAIAWISSVIGIVWVVMCYTSFKGTAPVDSVVSEDIV